jgi:hypothetical protein
MSLKVVKSKSEVKAEGGGSASNLVRFVRCKIATDNFASHRKSIRQMRPERTISSGSAGTFRTTAGQRKCLVTTINATQSD